MNKNCPAMASPTEEPVGEFLFLMSKWRRSDLEICVERMAGRQSVGLSREAEEWLLAVDEP
jgi:hypothetical protein